LLVTTDRIEKKTVLRAPRDRVWNAIADVKQFGTWFGVEIDGPFVAGKTLAAKIRPTKVDAEIAKMQQPYDGVTFEIVVERVEPMRELAFRWHPGAVEPGVDYATEPMTLVQFLLDEAADGTQLTIIESGFDRIPLERRANAFKSNDSGWAMQLELIAKYLAR
jgi:uncharacterized protein YndB with AHSA1/START domain